MGFKRKGNYWLINGNEITKMEEPDGPEIIGQKMARISYEIKTISPYNEPA